jgi:DNA-binding FadR family transcriptional regulator
MELAYEQHRALLDALKQRDPGKARKAMRIHLRAFQRGYRVLLNNKE